MFVPGDAPRVYAHAPWQSPPTSLNVPSTAVCMEPSGPRSALPGPSIVSMVVPSTLRSERHMHTTMPEMYKNCCIVELSWK